MIQGLKFDEQGLIPAVVQDSRTQQVLTLAYMNAESLALTLQLGEVCFFSRSRQELWHKGKTSGNTMRVVDIALDCDGDALVVRVEPRGPACHTGAVSCFHNSVPETAAPVETSPTVAPGNGSPAVAPPLTKPGVELVSVSAMELGILLEQLYRLIAERKALRPEGSYTTYLFNAGLDKILKKVGEEATETVIAAKNGSRKEMSAEISDLFYHLLVLMVEREVALHDILQVLKNRAGKATETK
ncbi:MAG: bifunctional phosphoribosyl-AMP cyclohydrolase/phosphoribosyl-ATP diphosphatase HisIE [Blastocatellia bacterium]|nr:bifunctional phosphoribosyl-AMP cyclohydrolase/phosphoribosyl-ATP diphosphatase HisIE [Blastocatellia bacterium]